MTDLTISQPRSPVEVVRTLVDAVRRGGALEEVLARDVIASGYFTGDRELRGITAVASALRDARSSMYSIGIERLDGLDAACVVGVGSVRHHPASGGFSHHAAAWIWVARSGVLSRWESFPDPEGAARRHPDVCPIAGG